MPNASATTTARPNVRQLSLDNGLEVVWEEDHRQPLVAIEVRIEGGLRGEGVYLGTGITHFIEHMLFKGTTSRAPGTIDQEVRRYGGSINAFTSFDTTGVSLFIESKHLKEALGMLADILQHAVFDQTEFEKERAVVISEIQMNQDDPDRRVYQLLWSRHLLEHSYRHPILGYQPLLESLKAGDMAAFYASQYQPQNVTIACVGDLDGAAFADLMKEAFGSWPRGRTDPLQRLVPIEPPTATAKEASVELPVQTAYMMLGFSSVRLTDGELYPLDLLAAIIGDGHSSRLYQTLVRTRQLAHTVNSWNYTPYDPGLFVIALRTDADKLEQAKAAALEILDAVKQQGVTEAELRKAKRTVKANYLFGLQTIEAKAGDLANSLTATGDPMFSRRYVEGVEQVTSRQVQEAAQRYCDALKMTTAIIRPRAETAAAATSSVSADRLQVTKAALPNGATTLIGVDHALPIATVVVAFHGGVRVEEERTQGLSNLVAQMLTKGTSVKSALEIAQQIESLGGTLEPFSGRDGFGLTLQLLAEDLPQGLKLMHELVTQSTFPEDELAIQRTLIEKQLQAQEDEIFDVGGRLLRRTLFGPHPYRFAPLGDPATVPSLDRTACVAFTKRWVTPSNAVLSVFGDLDAKAVSLQMSQTFGTMPSATSPWPTRLPEPPLDAVKKASQTMDKEQALVMLGFLAGTYTAPERDALDVMTAMLSGMSGRLFQSVREAHGLSYTLGAVHAPGWDPGYLLVYAATRPDEQAKVLQLMNEQLQLAADKGFTEEELEQAKRYLIGSNRLDIQNLVGLARRSAIDELYGVGFDAWMSYEKRINAVTVPLVNDAAKRYLTLQRHAQVLISPNSHATKSSP